MEYSSAIDSIREINYKIFFNLDEEINFNQLLLQLLEIDNYENNFDLLVFLNLLENKDNLSCSEKIFLNRIKSKIIMDYFMNNSMKNNSLKYNCENNNITENNNTNKNITENNNNNENITPEYFKEYFLAHNQTINLISKEIELPKEGKLAKIRMKDNTTFPGNEFSFYLIIDHLGNILEMEGNPIKMKNDEECFKIYDGLLGKIFNYQQAVTDEQQ